MQKLASEFAKASESLKNWGLGEGEDLGVSHLCSFLFEIGVLNLVLGRIDSFSIYVWSSECCSEQLCEP